MTLLAFLGVADTRLVGKGAGHCGRPGDLAIKLVQRAADQFADDRTQFAYRLSPLAVESDEIKALLECVFELLSGHTLISVLAHGAIEVFSETTIRKYS
ncbi:hypothetical protein EV128_101608 [Rhizobium azibense]|nr:hypothetical protein EV128_101608 [Rhizobium azibense]